MAGCCLYGAFVISIFLSKYESFTFSMLSDSSAEQEEREEAVERGLLIEPNAGNGFDKILEYNVEGMTCASCVAAIETTLLQKTGVKHVNANFLLGQVVVLYERLRITPAEVKSGIEAAGFEIVSTSPSLLTHNTAQPANGWTWNWGAAFSWSLLFTIPIQAINALPSIILPGRQRQLYTLILASFVQFGFGLPFHRQALKVLRHGKFRHLPIDLSIALSTSVAYGASVYCYAAGVDESHAATTASLITVISLGRHLETRSRRSVTTVLRAFAAAVPTSILLRKNRERIPRRMLRDGDVVEVAPGERFPSDGRLHGGQGCATRIDVDESYHTGESSPVLKELGDICLAGTINSSTQPVLVEVADGGKSRLGAIVDAVLSAQSSKADLQLVTERVASVIVPVTLLLAVITFLLWWPHGGLIATRYMTATLVAVCPCALSISTPMAVMISSVVAARKGIVVKSGAKAFEVVSRATAVVFDKTGTLTSGRMSIQDVHMRGGWTEGQWWQLIRAAEEGCEHWASEAICQRVEILDGQCSFRTDYLSIPGRGIRCSVGGVSVLVGNLQHLRETAVDDVNIAILDSTHLDPDASCVYVALDGVYAGYIAMKDRTLDHAGSTVRALKAMGLKIYMITGDRKTVAAEVGKSLGIDQYWGEQTPQEKLAVVQELGKRETVIMIGDGINDAPALASASVGIAPHQQASSLALASADIVLLQYSVAQILSVLELAKATFSIIRWNLLWTALYNVAIIPPAMGLCHRWGITVPPTAAGFLMMGSSLSVTLNCLRLDHASDRAEEKAGTGLG